MSFTRPRRFRFCLPSVKSHSVWVLRTDKNSHVSPSETKLGRCNRQGCVTTCRNRRVTSTHCFGTTKAVEAKSTLVAIMCREDAKIALLYISRIMRVSARRFSRGVLISLFFGLLAFGFDLLDSGIVMVRELPRQAIPFVRSTPFLLALMLSLCGTLPSAATKRAKRIRISE